MVTARSVLRPGVIPVAWRELRRISRRPALLVYVLVLPLTVFLVLAAAFGNGVATDLPIAVLDQDRSSLSRQIVQVIDATPEVAVAQRPLDLAEAKHMVQAGLVYGVVLLPSELQRDVRAGRRPEVALFYNNQFMTPGSTVARSVQTALSTVTAGLALSTRVSQGEASELATAAVNPIPLQQSALFNPGLDYVQFLLATLMPAVLQIFICSITAYVVLQERLKSRRLDALALLGGGLLPAMLGKLVPYTLIFATVLGLGDAFLLLVHDVPFRGNMPIYLAGSLSFIVAYQALGLAIGLAVPSASMALGLAGLITAPAFGFIGVSFPRLAMHGFASIWGNLLPLTWYTDLRVDQMLRGVPLDISLASLAALGWSLLAYLAAAMLLLYGRTHMPSNLKELRP